MNSIHHSPLLPISPSTVTESPAQTKLAEDAQSMSATSVSAKGEVSSTKNSFNPYINGFRGFCVLLVFAFHVTNSGLISVSALPTPSRDAFLFFTSSWRYGVELFFMISGFVIVNSLRRHNNIPAFLMDRCIRIFPVWVPVNFCIFVLASLLGWKYFASTTLADKLWIFVANLFLLPPLIPTPVVHPASWSLTYEWLFYLCAAAAFSLSLRQTVKRPPSMWILLCVLVACLLMLLPRALFFLPGVIVALSWSSWKEERRLLRFPWLSLLVFLVAWRMVNLDEARPTTVAIMQILSWPGILYASLAFIAGLHLFACVCNGSGATRWLQHTSMQVLGNISYSFYLWHPIVMFAVKKGVTQWLLPRAGWVWSAAIFALLSFVIAFVISSLSCRLIEQRLAKQLRAWSKKPTSVIATQSTTVTAMAISSKGGTL